MFKKFLVLCVMLSSLISWSDEKNARDSVTNIVAVEEIAEISMSDEATSAELRVFEELALTDPIRALELSMYYQGWGKDIFYSIGATDKSGFLCGYPKDSELFYLSEMRDFTKALFWATLACDKNIDNPSTTIHDLNYFSLLLFNRELVYDKNNFISKVEYKYKIKKLLEDFENSKLDKLGTFQPFSYIFAYMYYKGIGVEKNLDLARLLIQNYEKINWKNFFIGKFVPKDIDFAIFILKIKDDLESLDFLYLIYSGELGRSYENEKLALHYKNLYKEKLKSIETNTINIFKAKMKSIRESTHNESTKNTGLAYYHLKKYLYYNILYNHYVFLENPYYNLEVGEEYLNKTNRQSLDKYKKLIWMLISGNSIKDSKSKIKEILEGNYLTASEKEELKESANTLHKSIEYDLTPSSIRNMLEKPDLESL